MADPRKILELAREITDASQIICQFASANRPHLSFDSKDPDPADVSGPDSQAYHEARMTALEAVSQMSALLSGNTSTFVDAQLFSCCIRVARCSNVQTRSRSSLEGSISYEVNEGLAAMVGFSFEELYGYSYHITDALVKWGPSQEPNETGFNYAQDTEHRLYEWMPSTAGLTESMGDAVVVDVAGSVGHVSMPLSRRYPNLQFIVQDYESVCRQGEASLPAELRGRVRFQPKDMFQGYVLRILQAIVSTLKPGDRIVLNEQIMPEPGTASPKIEKLIRCV
ncbi:hypothetical protein BDW59DRAFT_166308 [Aspergillus cavernicola]|uniref:O-methyltransferase domain-containing protein n=1 Tax=Aspergillus cavernicola TaxID=176166 RepID=A0ABR4HN39_9EURO